MIASSYLTYRYRLRPSKGQHAALAIMLEQQRQIYNAALQERNDVYRLAKRSISKLDQFASIKDMRDCFTGLVNCARWTLARVDDAYQAFFRRAKQGGKAGFPRFRSFYRWRSFGFNEMNGVRFDGRKLSIHGLSAIAVRTHRTLPPSAVVKSCVVSQDCKGWVVSLQVAVPAFQGPIQQPSIGIDVGLKTFLATSDGKYIGNPRFARKAEKEVVRLNHKLARAQRGSTRREKTRRAL